ncbi:MAG TPA: hypothetical protein DDW76_22440 [Cyanobacteria bacterium UBA11369]|nr:hypothetical protein [Cyanobacteria bacterium UBA11371]HBE51459.1 hypothetical protein [Cyanobacteria bacterium UBA11369]
MNTTIKSIAIASVTLFLVAASPVAIATNSLPQITVAQSVNLRDTLIIPGERVGPVTRNTSRRDLARLFGESRLRDKTISGAEGIGQFAATDVNLGRERSFTVVWSNSAQNQVGTVRNFGTAWKTREGIGVGTSLTELRRILGEFQLSGLAWDYGGTVVFERTRLARYQGGLTLVVDAAPDAAQRFPNNYQAVSGDSLFSSNNPNWQRLGIKVAAMTVYLASDEGI